MALNHSPKIITNGLVFYYDMGNTKKSNIGDITTNLITNPSFSNGTTDWSNYALSTVPFITTSKDVPTTLGTSRNVLQCNTLGTIHGGGNYGGTSRSAPSLTAGITYTISFYARSASGTMQLNFSHQNGDGANSNLAFSSNIGTSWARYSKTATLDIQKNTFYFWNQTVANGVFQLADVQLEAKSTATNFTSSARSSTQSILDLTGNNTLTVSSLTYSNSVNFSFNGTSDSIISPENSIFNTQTPTVEVWVKTNSLNQNGFWFEKGQVNTQYALFQEGSNIIWRMNIGGITQLTTTTATYMNTSSWYQVVGTYSTGRRRLYINGVLVNSDTQSGTIATNANGISIGVYGGFNGSRGYYYNGNIGIVKVYNRELTADEVSQNFNALRGRYGI